MANPVDPVYVQAIDSFKKECVKLLTEFKEKESDNFTEFVTVWKANKFTFLYERYSKYGHENHFKEDSLLIAKSFMLGEHFVGGMYLLYGLYFVQGDPKQAIRLELDEFTKIKTKIRDGGRPLFSKGQLGYVFAKLLKNDAFDFTMFSREFSMEGMNRARVVFGEHRAFTLRKKTFCPQTWMQDLLAKTGLGKEIEEAQSTFLQLKTKFQADHPDIFFDLNMVPDDFMTGLDEAIEEKLVVDKTSPDNIGIRRRELKSRKILIRHRYERVRRNKQVGRPSKKAKAAAAREAAAAAAAKRSKTISKPEQKTKGRPRGKRKTYIKAMINKDANTESESGEDADVEFKEESNTVNDQPGCSFDLPDI